jgi:hypothetical protein
MLERFVREEILGVEPYDPVGAFGARVFLFADEAFPVLARLATRSPSIEVRRNAVSALDRYRTVESAALLRDIAADSADAVVLMRALAGLGRFHAPADQAPLVSRLRETSDRVEEVALVGALGRSGTPEVFAELLALAEEAFDARDSDLLQAALTALARLPIPNDAEVLAQAEDVLADVERIARQRPRAFPRAGRKPRIEADRPDGPNMRGRVIHQLAVVARLRLAPGDPERRRALLGLLGGLQHAERWRIEDVLPPAQILVLRALAGGTEPEVERFLRLVAVAPAQPFLRTQALGALPLSVRTEVALETLAGSDPEARLAALELLLADHHEASVRLCRDLVSECAALEPDRGTAARRQLYLRALSELSQRELLETADLLPLLHHVRSPRQSHGTLPEELEAEVGELLARAADGVQNVRLRELVRELVDFVVRNRMNPAITAQNADAARAYVLGLIDDVRSHRADDSYLRTVRDAVMEFLLGYPVDSSAGDRAQFAPPVLLEEEILLALGRTRSPQAAELLLTVLADGKNVNRALACLALGMTGQRSSARELPRFLLDADPFTRFCAWEGLRALTEIEDTVAFVDWMYAPAAERTAGAEEVFRWLVENER